ncbi:DUF5819 family protein [Streptomyces yaizuensis]|uniref:DUF5819 family protein n=1 Tax=Streptomyces yaizuensis TaxID=2989713 RepID=A0ABQ5P252_9ACTN|nr:DUF5819 family protein [Streptomyces sp. YSPA8]GLF96671.1 DUF5819 family protein [Streptomyces sp. YSPA8]
MGSYEDRRADGAPIPWPEARQGPPGHPPAHGGHPPSTGIFALSPPYRITAALALTLVAALAAVHLTMVFLHVAPPNTATKQYGKAIDAWIYPEFEQNWKLFAPNPLQQNVAVEVRAEFRARDGARAATGWIGLTAGDAREIRGNPLPSHVHQNELRRAWDFYVSSHDDKNRATGPRGTLAERYLRRIALLRLDRHEPAGTAGTVERIQFRSVTTVVEAPPWSGEKTDTRPVHRVLPWWNVTEDDLPPGTGATG